MFSSLNRMEIRTTRQGQRDTNNAFNPIMNIIKIYVRHISWQPTTKQIFTVDSRPHCSLKLLAKKEMKQALVNVNFNNRCEILINAVGCILMMVFSPHYRKFPRNPANLLEASSAGFYTSPSMIHFLINAIQLSWSSYQAGPFLWGGKTMRF